VLGIDASAALELPNTQVFTAADIDIGVFPPPPMPMIDKRMARPFVAGDVVRFAGEIVAVVATEDRTAGADAAELVMVDYDPLPATPDPRRALAGEVERFPEHGTNVCMREGPDERDAILEVTIGGSKDGAIEAYRLQIIQNVGAYAGIGAFLPHLTGLMASGVYAIPKIEVQAHAVVTNTTPVGPFRGAGRPEAAQA